MRFIAGNMVKKVKNFGKMPVFNDLGLIKRVCRTILGILAVGFFVPWSAGADGRVRVTVSGEDTAHQEAKNNILNDLLVRGEELERAEKRIGELEAANRRLRLELTEKREELDKQNRADREFRLWLAEVLDEGTVRKSAGGRDRLAVSLGGVSEAGGKFALETAEFCEQVSALLDELPVGKVRKAEFQLKIDRIRKAAREYAALTGDATAVANSEGGVQTCRILALDKSLGVAVLSAGTAKGAFAGMLYRAGKDGGVSLKVIGVKPDAAMALIVNGSIDDLAPGMEAVAGEKKTEAIGIFGR